jgi:formylglycine-generating enzyme required for sulfatase activity
VAGEGGSTSGLVYITPGESSPVGSSEKNNGFYIDRYEVTQADYFKVMRANPSFFKGDDRPVEKVSWNLAVAFCAKVGKRLPTEQEWERAIRAGTTSPYYWGENQPDRYAWHKGNADKQTHVVGEKEPNSWGLYDMAGNVWEWTQSDHECPEEEEQEMRALVKKEMEGVVPLKVPLVVDMGWGKNWNTAH